MLATDYFRDWLNSIKPNVQTDTYETYTICFEKHIIPYFAAKHAELENIHPLDVKNFATAMFDHGRSDGKGGLGKASVRKLLALVKQALNEAECLELVERSPARSVRLPKTETLSKDIVFLSADEANIMLHAFEGSIYRIPVVLALRFGLRRSEVLGLKWSAVDFKRGTIEICHTVVKNLTTVCKDNTKTESSRRKFTMTEDIRDMLLKRKAEVEQAAKDNPAYTKSPYICTDKNGILLRPDSLTRGFQRVLHKNGLQHMRFHDLRHSTASILYDSGMQPKEVQEYLGHSDIETTLNIYTHLGRGRKSIVSERMAALVRI